MGLCEEGFPVRRRETTGGEVGAGGFAAVVEEAGVIRRVLEGGYLFGNEVVEGVEVGEEIWGEGEVHCSVGGVG